MDIMERRKYNFGKESEKKGVGRDIQLCQEYT